MGASVDERGRVVIPQEFRERLGLMPGTEVRVEVSEGGVLVRPARQKREIARQLRGIIPKGSTGPRLDPRRVKHIWSKGP